VREHLRVVLVREPSQICRIGRVHVSFRFRDGGQINGVPVADAVAAIVSWIERRENDSPTADALRSVLA